MPDWLSENWQVIVPLVLGVAIIFWPNLRPILQPIIDGMKPKQEPVPAPVVEQKFVASVKAADQLVEHFVSLKDPDGEQAAREAGKALFATCHKPKPKAE